MGVLPGNPTLLKARTEQLVANAEKIQAAIEDLHKFALSSKGKSVMEATSRAADAEKGVRGAHGRYKSTGQALQRYQVAMAAAHRKADQADAQRQTAARSLAHAQRELSARRAQVRSLESADVPDQVKRQAKHEQNLAEGSVRRQQGAMDSASAAIDAARREMNEAAESAGRQIDTAISSTNDGFFDYVNAAFDVINTAWQAVKQWAISGLSKLIEHIGKTLKVVFETVLPVVLVIVAVVVAIAIVAAFIINPVGTLLVYIAALLAISAANVLVPMILESLRPIFAFGAVALLLMFAFQSPGEVFGKQMRRSVFIPRNMDEARAAAKNRSRFSEKGQRENPIDSADDYLESCAQIDKMGNKERAVIDIKQVGDDPKRWVVTLPSTQDLAGNRAPNDWPLNFVLAGLPPQIMTAYEREIASVMRQAGISPTDEVMMVGFSQAGLISTRFAANPGIGFNITRVISVGAPVGHINVPPVNAQGNSVVTVDIAHRNDLVPKATELMAGPWKDAPHRNSHVVSNHYDQFGRVIVGGDPHNADHYWGTAKRYFKDNPDVAAEFDQFSKGQVKSHEFVEIAE